MVIFIAAVGCCCYGCDTIATLGFENERIVKEIAFIFSTGVAGSNFLDVLWREGGLLPSMATIMVGVLLV